MSEGVFKATYSDFKNVKTRKTVQFIFEVPAEAADEAMAVLGGVPRADQEIWVGIARINAKAASAPPIVPDEPVKERRKFNTLPLPQQAAMVCQEGAFPQFLVEAGYSTRDAAVPEKFVREYCMVNSRSDILPGTHAAEMWTGLYKHYRAWLSVDA